MAIDPVGTDSGLAAGEYDAYAVAAAIRQLLIAIGEDPDRDGLRKTPERVARSYAEMFGGLRQDPEDVLTTVFDVGHEELVIVKDIQLYSTCEHHFNLVAEYQEWNGEAWDTPELLIPYAYRVPVATPTGSSPALDGTLELAMPSWHLWGTEADSVRFLWTLWDRDLNPSNVASTPGLPVP